MSRVGSVIAKMLEESYRRYPRLHRLVEAEKAAELPMTTVPLHSTSSKTPQQMYEVLEDLPTRPEPTPWLPALHVSLIAGWCIFGSWF